MKKAFYIVLFLYSTLSLGQKEKLNRELTYGLHFSSTGGTIGGFDFRKAWFINEKRLGAWSLSLAEIKHPKEEARSFNDLRPFKPGKSYGLYVLRSNFATEFTLFRKYHEDGIKLNLILGAGPTIGFLKPYYIEYITGTNSNGFFQTDFAQYDPDIHTVGIGGNVISSGGFFRGWGGIKIKPAINTKVAMSFEFGQFNRSISGIEIGLLTDIFTERIILFPEASNKFLFTSGYVALFYGRRKYKKPKTFRD